MALDLSNLEKPGINAAGAVPTPAATPEDNLEASFVKLGGKVVRAATPKESVEPDPEAFAEAGGKFVGKIPTTMPPAKD
jgi:hypothetical protein